MADVFSGNAADDEEETPGIRVASAMTGGEEDGTPEETPQAAQPKGAVDSLGQSYLTPVADAQNAPQVASSGDGVAVSPDTKAYMNPVAPPQLAAPAPLVDHSGDQAEMTAQKQAEANQNIKPSFGRRLLAGLAGGAVAFGGGDGAGVVEKVLNRPADQAKQQWALQEAPIQARLNADNAQDNATRAANVQTEQANRLAETNYGNQIRAQQDAARAQSFAAQAAARNKVPVSFTPHDAGNPYAGGTVTAADGTKSEGPPPDSWVQRWVKTPQGQLAALQMTVKQRGEVADQIGLKGEARQRYMVDPKNTFPTEHQSVSIREGGSGGGANGSGSNPNDPGPIIAKNMQDKQAYVDSLTKMPDGTYTDKTGATISPQQFNDRIEKFRTDLNANPVMRKTGTMVDAQGNTVNNRFSRNPQPAAQSQIQAQQTPAATQQQRPATQTQQKPPARVTPPPATMPAPPNAQGRVKGSDGNWYWFAGHTVLGRSN